MTLILGNHIAMRALMKYLFVHVPCYSSLQFPVHIFMYSNKLEYINNDAF